MDLPYANNWDLVGRRRWWYLVSLMVIIPGAFLWMSRGLNKGIDFTGGVLMKFEADASFVRPGDEAAPLAKVRDILKRRNVTKAKVQLSEGRTFLVRAQVEAERRGRTAVEDTGAEGEPVVRKDATTILMEDIGADLSRTFGISFRPTRELVEPIIGKELALNAVKALVLGCGLILIYISWRYQFRFAVAAIIALLHDCLVLVGVFALTQMEIDSSFVAALLTVVGYSINDTVVIFDRIRENMRLHRREPFPRIVNASLWQTMARSINTVVTTLFTLVALFFLGGPTIHNFALALIVGISSGCYSSIFTASPVLVSWMEWSRRRADKRERVQRERLARPRLRPAPKPEPQPQPALPTAASGVGAEVAESAPTTPKPSRPREPKKAESKRTERRRPRGRGRRRRF
ncbi:MAG: protein translocase subunit SecF [Armatimonadota bacterium]